MQAETGSDAVLNAGGIKSGGMGKKLALAGGVVVAVLAVAGYFVAIPLVQVNNYKKTAEAKHAAVDQMLVRVYDTFKRGVFTSSTSTAQEDKVDLQVTTDAIKEARHTLDSNAAAMTDFRALPLLDWSKTYKKAAATKSAESNYVRQAQSLLSDYDALVAYASKMTDLNADLEKVAKKLESIGLATTPGAMAALIDADANEMQAILDRQAAVVAPDYLRAQQVRATASATTLLNTLKGLSTAVRVLDLEKITKLGTDMDAQANALDVQGQAFIDDLQQKSPIAGHIAKLKDLNKIITANYRSM